MKLVKFKYNNGYYSPVTWNDDDLLAIAFLITDLGTSSDWLIRQFTYKDSRGFVSNSYNVDFIGNKAFIEPLYVEDPKKWRIEVDKDVLHRLAITWQELVDKKAEEITIIQDNGEIKMIGKLPEDS